MLGGHAQAVMTPVSLAAAQVKAGKLRLLAHTGTAPVAAYPDVPSFKSQGYDVEYTAWAGLVAPKSTPPHVIKILRDATRQAVKEPEVVGAPRQARHAHRLHGRRRVQCLVGAGRGAARRGGEEDRQGGERAVAG